MRAPLLEIERQKAKQRQIELGKTHGEDPLGSFEHKGKARDIVAKKIGVSPITFQRALVIIDKGSEKEPWGHVLAPPLPHGEGFF